MHSSNRTSMAQLAICIATLVAGGACHLAGADRIGDWIWLAGAAVVLLALAVDTVVALWRKRLGLDLVALVSIAGAILLESSLSFLGFGVQPPESSLGLLISQYQNAFTTRPWLFWWPGMIIVAIALSVNFLGDGLRDAFDPRQVGKKRRRRAGMFALPTRKEKP